MTRAITSFKAFAVYIDEPVTTRCIQHYNLVWTQANSDLAADLADVAGTFWTEAGASGVGLDAKTALAQIIAKAGNRISWCAPTIQDPKTLLAASGSLSATTQYQITTTSIVPSFLFYTAGAPTAVNFHLSVLLNKEERGVRAGSI